MYDGFSIVSGVFTSAELDSVARDLEGASLQRSRAGARHLHASSKVVASSSRRVIHFEYAAPRVFEHGLHLRRMTTRCTARRSATA
jgi:hypothetical protein